MESQSSSGTKDTTNAASATRKATPKTTMNRYRRPKQTMSNAEPRGTDGDNRVTKTLS